MRPGQKMSLEQRLQTSITMRGQAKSKSFRDKLAKTVTEKHANLRELLKKLNELLLALEGVVDENDIPLRQLCIDVHNLTTKFKQ